MRRPSGGAAWAGGRPPASGLSSRLGPGVTAVVLASAEPWLGLVTPRVLGDVLPRSLDRLSHTHAPSPREKNPGFGQTDPKIKQGLLSIRCSVRLQEK